MAGTADSASLASDGYTLTIRYGSNSWTAPFVENILLRPILDNKMVVVTVESIEVDGGTGELVVVCTLSGICYAGQSPKVSHAADWIVDDNAAGVEAASDVSITNNSTVRAAPRASLGLATVGSDGTSLVVKLPPPLAEKPMFMLWHQWSVPLASLQAALDSGLVTHVMLTVGNRYSSDTLSQQLPKLALCQSYGIPTVLVRFMWRYAQNPDLADAQLYIDEIDATKAEATSYGFDFTAIDFEPYSDPLKTKFYTTGFTESEIDDIRAAMLTTIAASGYLDFMMPAHSLTEFHPQNEYLRLARLPCTENVYREDPDRWTLYYTGHVRALYVPMAGLYLAPQKANPPNPDRFITSDLDDASRALWAVTRQVRGLWAYVSPDEQEAVCAALKAHGQNRVGLGWQLPVSVPAPSYPTVTGSVSGAIAVTGLGTASVDGAGNLVLPFTLASEVDPEDVLTIDFPADMVTADDGAFNLAASGAACTNIRGLVRRDRPALRMGNSMGL